MKAARDPRAREGSEGEGYGNGARAARDEGGGISTG
jgi:hypothetical protein